MALDALAYNFFRDKKKGYLRNQVKSLIKLDFNLCMHMLTELNEQKFKFKTEDNLSNAELDFPVYLYRSIDLFHFRSLPSRYNTSLITGRLGFGILLTMIFSE